MGHKLDRAYPDHEPGLSSKYTTLFPWTNSTSVITRTHAAVAERQVRSSKICYTKDWKAHKQWTDHIGYVWLTYNHKMINRWKPKNELSVKHNIILHAKHNRMYPDINIGDKVRIYTKKKTFGKAHKSVWSKDSYEVVSIDVTHGQQFYKLKDNVRPFMRHEILKVAN